ncbi:MAG: MBL fold metallo-hydrolase, partial [Betaproteobacteria bacterium AqS2]|nr:MBL fold metallo-hydrolase [Betaproteobacteria bacterium AqS2]
MNARRGLLKALAAGAALWLLGTFAKLLPRQTARAQDAAATNGQGARLLPNGRFANNYIPPVDRSIFDVRKAFAEGFPPELGFELAAKDPAALAANRTRPSATWIGHCTLLVQAGGLNILTDPHFTERASPLPFAGPKRTTPPGLALAELPPIDVVLVSHNHYDHLDYRSIQELKEHSPAARYYVPLGLKKWFEKAGVANCVERDWWQEDEVAGAKVTAVPCQHWSNRSGFDRNRTLWCAWTLETGG